MKTRGVLWINFWGCLVFGNLTTLRRIVRRVTKPNPIQISSQLLASRCFTCSSADCSARSRDRTLSLPLLLQIITVSFPVTSKRSHSCGQAVHLSQSGRAVAEVLFSGPRHTLSGMEHNNGRTIIPSGARTLLVLETHGPGDAFPWGAWPRDAAVDTRK